MLLSFDVVYAFMGVHEVVEGFSYGTCWGDSWLHDIYFLEENGVREESRQVAMTKIMCVQ